MKQTIEKSGKERKEELDASTTIALSMETRDRLKDLGKKGETYDTIINRLIDLSVGKWK